MYHLPGWLLREIEYFVLALMRAKDGRSLYQLIGCCLLVALNAVLAAWAENHIFDSSSFLSMYIFLEMLGKAFNI